MSLTWHPPGERTKHHDVVLPYGMFFATAGTLNYPGEPSAVQVWTAFGRQTVDPTLDLGYYPSYEKLTPEQRRSYLEWLSAGRRDVDPAQRALGYLFLFFYGLERRISLDGDRDPLLLDEILGLLEHYGPAHNSRSLRSYFLGLAHFGGWQLGHEYYRTLWPRMLALDDGKTGEESLKLVLANLLSIGEPMHWSIAYRLALVDPACRRSVVMTRAKAEFWNLFQTRYEGEFGPGINLKSISQPCWYRYQPASAAMLANIQYGKRSPFEFKVPNVLGYAAQFGRISELWNSSLDDLSGYSRALTSKKKADPAGLKAWRELPEELRGSQSNPMQIFWDWVKSSAPREGEFAFVTAGSIATWLGIGERSKLTRGQSLDVAYCAADMGWCVAPHPQHTDVPFTWGQELAVYERKQTKPVEPQTPGIVRLLYLVMPIAAADGVVEPEEMETFRKFIADEITSQEDGKYIQAVEQALMRDTNVAAKALTSVARHVTPRNRDAIMHLLVNVAAADGEVSPEELKLLRRLSRAFGLGIQVPEQILRQDVDHAEVVILEKKAAGARSEIIPQRPVIVPTGLVLNADRIAALARETHEVVAMLSEVMEDEPADKADSGIPEKVEDSPIPETEEWLSELDPRFHPIVMELQQRDALSMSDFEALVGKHHLLAEDVINSINDWSDEVLGDFLLDRSDPVKIHRELFKAQSIVA